MLAAIAAATLVTAFRELDQMCTRDHGRLWGVSLCGPVMFVHPQTRELVTNQPAPPSTLPQAIAIPTTSVARGETRCTMAMLPLPDREYEPPVLLAHQTFHHILPRR